MAVSLRDFVKAIFGLYLVTLVVVVWDFYQTRNSSVLSNST